MTLRLLLVFLCITANGLAEGRVFGTGFAVTKEGFIITCHHVVEGAKEVFVHQNGKSLKARILIEDSSNDLALLKVEGWKGGFITVPPVPDPRPGTNVFTVGFPDPSLLGKRPKTTKGAINSLSGLLDDPRFLQISAAVQPGSSGGALLTEKGELVGVIASRLNSINLLKFGGYLPQNVNYAIKADYIHPLISTAGRSAETPNGSLQGKNFEEIQRHVESATVMIVAEGVARDPGRTYTSANGNSNQWVFPDSNRRLLTSTEASKLSEDKLWRARNELFVRHGYIFQSERGQAFAKSFGNSYRPRITSQDDVSKLFNDYERANLELLKTQEP